MANKKMSKSSKRSLLLFGTISLIIIGYFIYNIFFYTYNIYTLKVEEKKYSHELSDLEHNEKLLKSEIEKLKDPEYIARYAREKYQYSKDGEIILELNEKEEKEKIDEYKIEEEKILKICFGILILLVCYVIIKNFKKKK